MTYRTKFEVVTEYPIEYEVEVKLNGGCDQWHWRPLPEGQACVSGQKREMRILISPKNEESTKTHVIDWTK
jgi:hypothetical protein